MAILNHIDDAGIQDSVQSCRDMTYHQTPGAYLRGVRKPHYPVPAIRQEAFIYADRVMIWMDVHPDYDDYLFIHKS